MYYQRVQRNQKVTIIEQTKTKAAKPPICLMSLGVVFSSKYPNTKQMGISNPGDTISEFSLN